MFPTIPTVAAGRVLSSVNTVGGATLTFPNLSSLTKNSGDLLVAIVVCYHAATGSADNAYSGWGGGFTEFFDRANSTSVVSMAGAYKWSDGTETGTFTVTLNTASTTHDAQMFLLSIPGAHASTPPEGGTRISGTTTVADIPAFAPSWGSDDNLFIAVCGIGETSTGGSWTGIGTNPPDNYGNMFKTGMSADVIGAMEGAVAFRQLAAASDDPGGFPDVDLSNARHSVMLIAVRPVESATPVDVDGDGVSADAHADAPAGAFSLSFSVFPAAADGHGDAPLAQFVALINILDGEAIGAIGWAGSVTGTTTRSGTASGSIGWAGTADGAAAHSGSSSGTIGWAGSATGATDHSGIADGSVGWAGTVDGEAPITAEQGTADGSITWAGSVSGVTTRSGEVTGSVLWVGTADGATTHQGSATGSLGWSGSADGTTIYEGSTTGTIGWAGTVQGESPAVGVNDGSVNGDIAWAGTATGTAGYESAVVGSIVWAGSATGETSYQGSVNGGIVWAGSIQGNFGDFYQLVVIPGKLGTGYRAPAAGTGWTPGAPTAPKATARLGGRWIPGRLRL